MWRFDRDCEQVVEQVSGALISAEMLVSRSFDLRSARQSIQDCACPHHGMSQCACQYVILLVRHQQAGLVTLVAHGSDGQTVLSLEQSTRFNPGNQIVDVVGAVIAGLDPT